MPAMNPLDTITALSHEFGTGEYVKAGGGNTSCKDADTLWVKPSGTTLAGLRPESFVAMDRAALARLYSAAPPAESAAREELVQSMMAAAVHPATPGRASVEAPLHDSLAARYVVHTHPALVNGLTCALGGRAAAARLFPEALWVPYIDPGYTLCMAVRKAVAAYKAAQGREPAVILLENHGVFVSGDSAAEIRAGYAMLMRRLAEVYAAAGLDGMSSTAPPYSGQEPRAWLAPLAEGLGQEGAAFCAAQRFDVGSGPISPDHIVYAKSYPFEGLLTPANLRAFKEARGYAPRVIIQQDAILGVGASAKVAELALALAFDGARVRHFAKAFGGIRYLGDAARGFIENWEVESYRARQI